jgi:hypothetical protein
VVGELTFRHWSNAHSAAESWTGLVTLTVRLNSGLVGVDRTDQMAVDGVGNFKALSADNAGTANLP